MSSFDPGRLIKDRDGKPSAMRLVQLIWGLGLFGVWSYMSIHAGTLVAIPESVIVIFIGVITGKAIQSFGEGKQKKE